MWRSERSRLRRLAPLLAGVAVATATAAGGPAVAAAAGGEPPLTPDQALTAGLARGMRQAGPSSGAEVVDLTDGRTLFTRRAAVGRNPASVEKLYTAATALTRFGPQATFSTSLLGTGTVSDGVFAGTLYLRGGGDPTFGSAGFDRISYGTGASVQQLVAALITATGLRAVHGAIVADESVFDSDRGTPATNDQPSTDVEGELSGLAYDRGWSDSHGTVLGRPALTAGRALVSALRGHGVSVPRSTPVRTGRTPATATSLTSVQSPPLSTLLALTLAPSDNFFAEMLLKDLGAQFGGTGATAAGAAVVRGQIAASFGIRPQLDDGSGLSRLDVTTPAQVTTLLGAEATDLPFTSALAVAGRTGTLQDRMRHTIAQDRCRGKTGTLSNVSNLAGYCLARDGHTLAFALLMSGVDPYAAHPIQDRMAEAIARYDG